MVIKSTRNPNAVFLNKNHNWLAYESYHFVAFKRTVALEQCDFAE